MLRLYVPNDYMLKIKGEIIFKVFLTDFLERQYLHLED
jgi:hypothetical protein